MEINKIYCGDNLEVMKTFPSESVDLCYIDPPFFTQRDFGEFTDKFETLQCYIEFIRLRVVEIHRILKKTGSFYLHCDNHANSYLRVMCDKIFGYKRFLNEIIWDYGKSPSLAKKKFPRRHDVILMYSKSDSFTFNIRYSNIISERMKKVIKAGYNTKNMNGKKYLYYYRENAKGKIDESKYDIIKYMDSSKGTRFSDVWNIPILNSQSNENLRYPTQKPEVLLERIIQASSNEEDVILDAFCGSGTTLAVSLQLKRFYIGIDLNPKAVEISKKRIKHILDQRSLW